MPIFIVDDVTYVAKGARGSPQKGSGDNALTTPTRLFGSKRKRGDGNDDEPSTPTKKGKTVEQADPTVASTDEPESSARAARRAGKSKAT
jgi:hypothetical protein